MGMNPIVSLITEVEVATKVVAMARVVAAETIEEIGLMDHW